MRESESPIRGKRAGVVALGAFVVIYLALIALSFSDRLNSVRNIVLFAFLAGIGIVALVLLARLWRSFSRPTTSTPPA